MAGDTVAQSEQVRLAYESLVKQGYVVLDHVIDPGTAEKLHREFLARYHNHLQDSELPGTLKVGNKRYLMAIDLAGGFADCAIYANPVVVAIARMALDENAILESFGAVVSLPGAEQQHIHRDGMPLFDSAISPMLPAHALTLAMPLVDMNERQGSTALWPGSHRWRERNEEVAPLAPDVPAGSCMLWDFRLFHSGTANRSERPRPMIYATFARRWYQDPANFTKKGLQRLSFTPQFLDGVPEDLRSLFYHVFRHE